MRLPSHTWTGSWPSGIVWGTQRRWRRSRTAKPWLALPASSRPSGERATAIRARSSEPASSACWGAQAQCLPASSSPGLVERVYPSSRRALPRRNEEDEMANPVPAGSDVSSGTYRCTNCGNEIRLGSQTHIPPCPQCGNGEWDTVRGGDSVNDPYPHRGDS